ncbi:cation:proton antiporter [Rugamonas sp.]|uniref:cation:proton antiporter n=1 Tax=Rugamonas sp. TaxID=1926287 RepID=UPI0025FDD6CB|nr:cation:proton antiporter [Rugamonas sp.]
MQSILSIASDLSWPFAIALAWVAGEFGHRWTGLPRISFYGVVGFALAQTQLGVLPHAGNGPMLILADVAFGLILFELGYRINLRWLKNNPWIAVAGLVEAIGTFAVVYCIAIEFAITPVTALLLASLSMSTSPATVMRVINEERSAGQVSERVMHMSALNCVLAVFTFNVIVGFHMFHSSGDLLAAATGSLSVLLASAAAGAAFGVVVPAMLRRLGNMAQDATVAFALAVILLVAITYTTSLSPLLATLVFGLVARHRRVAFSQAQRNFGALGELLTVLLFVFAASTLEWPKVMAGLGLALAMILGRCVTKIIGVGAFSHVSGISWRKGVLTGVALTPVSVSVVLLLEHARHRGVDFAGELNALAAFILILELLGPIIIQRALIWAKETQHEQER